MATNTEATKDPLSPVAARAALDGEQANPRESLEDQAKEQERVQREELKAGQVSGDEKKAAEHEHELGETDRASLRRGGGAEPGVQGGFVDNMSARSDADALEGHFVTIDLNHKDVDEAIREAGSDYGVYVEPGTRDPETGYPVIALVRLRDSGNALLRVPYEALSRAEAGGRR